MNLRNLDRARTEILPLDQCSSLYAPTQLDENPEEWGHWTQTVQLVRRLGARNVQALGLGLGVSFESFLTETQVYPTRAVVAMSAHTMFNLGDAVSEPRAFSVQLQVAGVMDIGFAPMPDRRDGVDGTELARRYLTLLLGLMEKQPRLWRAAPPVFREAQARLQAAQ